MKVSYYAETDSLYIELSAKLSSVSKEIAKGLVCDFDAEDNVVGLEFDNASKILDLATLEMQVLPVRLKIT